MKGINLNGTIKTYSSVPKTWGNILGVNYMSDEDLKGLGFYDVVKPSTSASQQLGDIFFDADAEVFTYPVESRTYTQTVAELKEQKIQILNIYTIQNLQKLIGTLFVVKKVLPFHKTYLMQERH